MDAPRRWGVLFLITGLLLLPAGCGSGGQRRDDANDPPAPKSVVSDAPEAVRPVSRSRRNAPPTDTPAPGEHQILVVPGPDEVSDPAENRRFVGQILEATDRFYQSNPNYTCRITRQERVGGKLQPSETLLMNFRRSPRSVYYKWVDSEHDGRECVYVDGQNDGKLISLGGKADLILAGKRMKVDPNGGLARGKSRYSITESGMDKTVEGLIQSFRERPESVRFIGIEQPNGLERPGLHVEQAIAPNKLFPQGAERHWFFDPDSGRLMMLYAVDPKGELEEQYTFDRFFRNDSLEDSDFNPDVLWPEERTAKRGSEGEPPRGRVAGREKKLPK